jgi:hypothetical protein
MSNPQPTLATGNLNSSGLDTAHSIPQFRRVVLPETEQTNAIGAITAIPWFFGLS